MAGVDYEREAGAYDRARSMPFDALEPLRHVVARHVSPPVRRILDVGSGTGQFARAFAHWFELAVVGVEPSAGMRGQARALTCDPLVSYVAGRAEALPLRGRSCGCAWLSTVVHHIADLPACARELRRVLSDGAAVLVRSAFPGHHDRITLFRYFPDARRVAETFPSVERITRVFGAAGFAVECLDDVPQESAPSLRAFLERVRDHRQADSTLVGLSDEAFERGIRDLEGVVAAEATPRPVIDCLTLLVMR
jgi:ubiquinone/menaquinone biosynthesis C-methylase UbiE